MFQPKHWMLQAMGELFYLEAYLVHASFFFAAVFWIKQENLLQEKRFFFLRFLKYTQQSWHCIYLFGLILYFGYGQDKAYQDNVEASVAVLKKLSDDWKEQATKLSPHEPLREILKNLRQKVVFHSPVCMIYFLFIASGIAYQSPWHGLLNCVYCIELAECLNLVYNDLTIVGCRMRKHWLLKQMLLVKHSSRMRINIVR